jgi:hypothetical protein
MGAIRAKISVNKRLSETQKLGSVDGGTPRAMYQWEFRVFGLYLCWYI